MSSSVVSRLCDAMYKLIQKKPFADISIKELILEAKVNRSSYNYHFSDPEEVVDALFADFVEKFGEQLSSNYPSDGNFTHRFVMYSVLDFLKSQEQFIRVMHKAGFDGKTNAAFRTALINYLEGMKVMCQTEEGETYELQDGKVKDLRNRLHVQYILAYINFWISRDYSITSEEMESLLDAVDQSKIDSLRYYNVLNSEQ